MKMCIDLYFFPQQTQVLTCIVNGPWRMCVRCMFVIDKPKKPSFPSHSKHLRCLKTPEATALINAWIRLIKRVYITFSLCCEKYKIQRSPSWNLCLLFKDKKEKERCQQDFLFNYNKKDRIMWCSKNWQLDMLSADIL